MVQICLSDRSRCGCVEQHDGPHRASGLPGTGVYSIVRFELRPEGKATRVLLDHAGFPAGQGEHLAQGWHANYWEPLRKAL